MIELEGVTKKYGRKKVLDGVTFTAEKGQITCLIGINGVGKSTVMKAIMGLTPIHGGRITINGRPRDPGTSKQVTFIPDTIAMPGYMRIGEAMAFMQDFYDNWNGARAEELLTFFRLEKGDRISDLSKGNAAKMNMLLGLAVDSDFLLMDEPFSGIDMFSREQIANAFTGRLVEDRGVLITTHEINDIEHLLDKVVMLDRGRVVREFYTEDLRLSEGKSVADVMREVYLP